MNTNDRNGRTPRFSLQRVVSNNIKDMTVCRDLLKVVYVEKFLSLVLTTVNADSKQPTQKGFVRNRCAGDFKRFGSVIAKIEAF